MAFLLWGITHQICSENECRCAENESRSVVALSVATDACCLSSTLVVQAWGGCAVVLPWPGRALPCFMRSATTTTTTMIMMAAPMPA